MDRHREQTCGHQVGEAWWDEQGDGDWRVYTTDTMYKIDK